MIPVILSGGSGSRLWPLSCAERPKQFIALHDNHTLYQNTLLRLSEVSTSPPIIVCNEEHRFIVAESTREIGVAWDKIILEPFGRNTAPAIAIAALAALQSHEDCVLFVLPADHIIKDTKAFIKAVKLAEQSALQDKIVTFGIKPTSPHTEYGYIQIGKEIDSEIYSIGKFKEKPDLATAEKYLTSGEYLWNSGMFMFKASVFLKELEKYNPDVLESARTSYQHAQSDLDFLRLDKDAFQNCQSISIDYAIMEQTDKAIVVPLDAEWSDVGSWNSLWQASDKDDNGNVCKGNALVLDTSDSYIDTGNKFVATLGVTDILVIVTDDTVLVANKAQSQHVKKIVDSLK